MTLARTLVIALTICCAQWTTARSHYCTAHNAFGSLATGAATCSLENERLLVSNSAATPLMIMDTTLVAGNGNSTYQYTVRASLLTNKAGSSYVVTDEHGRRSRVSSTAWGVAFGYIDGLNYARVELRCANTNLYDDLTDRRQMVVTAVATQAGTDSVLQQWTLDRGLSLEDGLNSVRVTVTDGEATIAVGNKQLQTLGMVTLPSADGPTQRTGLFLSAGARLALERTVLTSDSEAPHRVATAWTREALDQHFATSSDPVEGYWQYQDRDIEERWLRLGGRYTLAVVNMASG